MIRVIILLVLVFSYIKASNCQDTLFSINKQSSNVKIVDVLENLAQKCKFSVKTKDKKSDELLNKELFLVHIEDYTLDDMFNFLFTKNNLFYDYNDRTNILTISHLETKSFVIDYVNLTNHTTETRKSINVGAAPLAGAMGSAMGGMTGGITGGMSSGMTGGMGTMGRTNGSTGGMGSGNSDSTTVVSSSEFTFWGNLSEEINSILSRDGDYSVQSSSIVNKDAGMVTITGTMDQVLRVEKYIQKLKHRLHKQVILEAKLIEVTYSNSRSRGVDWSKFQASVDGSFSLPDGAWINSDGASVTTSDSNSFTYSFSMEGLLNFLDTYGDINILSTPKIMTLNNQPAVINVGDQINFQYLANSTTSYNDGEPLTDSAYINGSTFVGLTLNIVPEITDDDFVVLKINPVISNMIGVYDSEQTLNSAPDIRIKQLSSIVKAKNGEKVVIGGLMSHTDDVSKNEVMLLGGIPIFGELFKSETVETSKKELIIVVIPKIIDYNDYPSIENIETLMKAKRDE